MEAHQVLLVPDLLKGGKESNILESLFSVIDNAKVQFQKHTLWVLMQSKILKKLFDEKNARKNHTHENWKAF